MPTIGLKRHRHSRRRDQSGSAARNCAAGGCGSRPPDFESGAARVDHLIDRRTVDFEARARQIAGGLVVELVLEAIGGDSLKKGYRLLAPTGGLGIFGVSSAATNKTGGMLGILSCSRARPGSSSIRRL